MVDPVNDAPFPNTDALNAERLRYPSDHSTLSNPWLTTFHPTPQNETKLINHVPGEPTISLTESRVFLQKELATPVLDELYHNLRWFSKRSSSNIDALHRQIIKGRNIVPTEESRLHLIWQEKRIFIKPIPLCLLNHDFWKHFLRSNLSTTSRPSSATGSNVVAEQSSASGPYRAAALGFLRSYAFLIQHRSDLGLAKEHHLIPKDVDWVQWSKFIAGFRKLTDNDVAKRYRYGQLRLTGLNWATRIFRPKSAATYWFYEEAHWSTVPYIREAAVPLAFIFARIEVLDLKPRHLLTTEFRHIRFELQDNRNLER
ncbi:hypothetical protein FOXYSP1_20569 [Fusarium oxysporum f. sp. phaseoli]